MKKIPYEQMIMGLDDLFFGRSLGSIQEATDRAASIEAYLDATGYTWDDVLEHMIAESYPYDQAQNISTQLGHPGLS